MTNFGYQEPASIQDRVESGIRTCEEGSLHELSNRIIHKV